MDSQIQPSGIKVSNAQAGEVTLNGVQMYDIIDGRVFSSQEIRLTNGTHIYNSEVLFAIQPIPCTFSAIPTYIDARYHESQLEQVTHSNDNYDMFLRFANDAIDLHQSNINVSNIALFGIDGVMILQCRNFPISTIHIPNGVYIIRVITDSGLIYQQKFLLKR